MAKRDLKNPLAPTNITVNSTLSVLIKEKGERGKYKSKYKRSATFVNSDNSGASSLNETLNERGEKGRYKSKFKNVEIKKDGTSVFSKLKERGNKGRFTKRNISTRAAQRKINRIKNNENK